jgi:putative ABC transport system ATP-binding protein
MVELGISIEHLRKRYGEGDTAVDALKDVNMTVVPGEVVGLIGPSGSGKSTLLKCLGAVIEPSSGKMVLGGQTIYDDGWKIPDLRALRRDSIGFVFQAPYLIPFLDVTDNVALLPMLAGRPNAEARERARRTAARVDRPRTGQPAACDPGRRADRTAGQRAGPGGGAHPQPDGLAVPHSHHRGDPRREDHPHLQADLPHPRRQHP